MSKPQQLCPVTVDTLAQHLSAMGLTPQVTSPQPGATWQVVTVEDENLIYTLLPSSQHTIVRVELHLDQFTPGVDLAPIMAANSVNSAGLEARVSIVTAPSSEDTATLGSQGRQQCCVLRVEYEIPIGPGMTSMQLATALRCALTAIPQVVDAMVVELERLLTRPSDVPFSKRE